MLVVSKAMSRRRGAVVNDDVLFGFRLRLFSLARELGNVPGVPDLRDPPVDLLPLAGTGPAQWARDAAAARAATTAHAQPDEPAHRGADPRLQPGSSGAGATAHQRDARPGALGRHHHQ